MSEIVVLRLLGKDVSKIIEALMVLSKHEIDKGRRGEYNRLVIELDAQRENQPERMVHGFNAEDIRDRADEDDNITDEEIEAVLDYLENKWDCNIDGNTQIAWAISEIVGRRG